MQIPIELIVMPECPYCAEEITTNTEKCPYCDSVLAASSIVAPKSRNDLTVCPYCAEDISVNEKICPFCDSPVKKTAQLTTAPKVVETPQVKPAKSSTQACNTSNIESHSIEGLTDLLIKTFTERAVEYSRQDRVKEAISDYVEAGRLLGDGERFKVQINTLRQRTVEQSIETEDNATLAEAIEHLDALIAEDSENARYFHLRGIARAKLKNLQEAIEDFTEASRLDPENSEGCSYECRADCYMILKEFELAIRDYSDAIKFFDDYDEFYFKRAKAFEAVERHKEARADQRTGLMLRLKRKSNDKNLLKRLIDQCSQDIQENPDDSDALRQRADSYVLLDDLNNASADYERLAEVDTSNRASHLSSAAELSMQQGQLDRSLELFSQAIQVDSNCKRAYEGRGKLYALLADRDLKKTAEKQ